MPAKPTATIPAEQTFLGLPGSTHPVAGSVSIVGAADGTSYDPSPQAAAAGRAPDAVRRAITAVSVHIDHWDFDFGGPLLHDGALRVFDLGDIPTEPGANARNRDAIETAIRLVRSNRSVPILMGGDDSVAIPYMRAFDGDTPLHLLQIDAHIDWRDRIGQEPDGYSSTMRRASELPFIRSMTQVGIRAVGSARREEVEAAKAWGANLITVKQARQMGADGIADTIPRDGGLLIHVDCDALDPSVCPGVAALSPGGFRLDEVTDLIAAALRGRRLTGFSIVEYDPARDIGGMSGAVVGRLICHVLGNLARQAAA